MKKYDYRFEAGRNLMTVKYDDCELVALWNDNEGWGELAVFSVDGNYAYRWDATGKRFGSILKSNYDYLMDKLLDGHDEKRVLHPDETKQNILENRYHQLTEQAIETLEYCETETDFKLWSNRNDVSYVKGCYVYGYGWQANALIAHVVPKINALGDRILLTTATKGGVPASLLG